LQESSTFIARYLGFIARKLDFYCKIVRQRAFTLM
jgi:hypothetical protein